MLKLKLSRDPYWIDMPFEVRVQVRPISTSLMLEMNRDPAVQDAKNEDAKTETMGVAMVLSMARLAIIAWEGVTDDTGQPVEVTPENINALMDVFQIFQSFQTAYALPALELGQEGNALPPLPNGNLAAADPTVQPVPKSVRPARAKPTARGRKKG